MHLGKGEAVALFILVGLIILGVIALPVVDQAVAYQNQCAYVEQTQNGPSEYEKEDLLISWWDLGAQWAMFIGTLAVFTLGIWSLRSSNRSATKALKATTMAVKQTKRSVDAYVNSERGRLTLIGAYRHVSNLPSMGFRFQNLGKTDMMIIGFDFYLQVVEKKSDTPRRPTFEHIGMEHVMEPKGAFGSKFGTHPESGHKLIAIPDDILAELKAGRELVCSFGFLASGPFGLYESCFTYFIPHGPDHTPLAYFEKELRYDRPLAEKRP